MGRAAVSGSRVPHLQRRHGTYHLRVRVPDDLRLRVGSREVRRSLRVHTFVQARPLALKYAARVMEVFDMARSQSLTRDDIRSLVQACFADLKQQVDDGFVPHTTRPDLEIGFQRVLFSDHSVHVSAQLADLDFRAPVTTEAAQLLVRAGLKPDELPENRLVDLCSGVARALLERDRVFHHRLTDRFSPYVPNRHYRRRRRGKRLGPGEERQIQCGYSSGSASSRCLGLGVRCVRHQGGEAEAWQTPLLADWLWRGRTSLDGLFKMVRSSDGQGGTDRPVARFPFLPAHSGRCLPKCLHAPIRDRPDHWAQRRQNQRRLWCWKQPRG